MRAIEIALAKAEADGQLSHQGQQSMGQAREQYELSEEYEPELIKRKFELAFSMGLAALSISTFYQVLPQPIRVLFVPLVLFAAWYFCKLIRR